MWMTVEGAVGVVVMPANLGPVFGGEVTKSTSRRGGSRVMGGTAD
jgi:hypothetical protein